MSMGQFTTDFEQRNVTVITPAWPSVLESVLRVRLGVTVFCILTLPRVTLGVTAKKVNTLCTTRKKTYIPSKYCRGFIDCFRV